MLVDGPMTWQQIQTALAETFYPMRHPVLIGVLSAMIRRRLVVRDGDYYGLAEHRERLAFGAGPSRQH